MSTERLSGRRVRDNEWLHRQAHGLIQPGDYGKQELDGKTMWFNCTPDGEIGYLAFHEPDRSGNYHTVTEHDDGTISVGGSIKGRGGEHVAVPSERIGGAGPISSRGGWHGWLERGVWRSA